MERFPFLHYSWLFPGAEQVPSQDQHVSAHLLMFAAVKHTAVATWFYSLRLLYCCRIFTRCEGMRMGRKTQSDGKIWVLNEVA